MKYRRFIGFFLSLCIAAGAVSVPVYADEDTLPEVQCDESFVSEEGDDTTSESDDAADVDVIPGESGEEPCAAEEETEEETESEEYAEVEVIGDEVSFDIEDDIEIIEEEEEEEIEEEEEYEEFIAEEASGVIEINEDVFPDEVFRNYVSSEIDDGDGILTPDEISSVISIDVHGLEVSSLDGIELFTNLKVLDCHDTPLTSLDISFNSLICNTLDLGERNRDCTDYFQYSYSDSVLSFDPDARVETSLTVFLSVEHYGAVGSDTVDDYNAFYSSAYEALYTNKNVVIIIPSGTFYIGKKVVVFSNTAILADEGATMISTHNAVGGMIDAAHPVSEGSTALCPRGDSCTHGGYTQAQNITISGGVWDRGTANSGYETSAFIFRHCANITLSNMTIRNCTGHFVNVSGCDNVMISNVVFTGALDSSIYTDNQYEFIEAVHTDFINKTGENSNLAKPFDNTPTINLTVTGCSFINVMAGIGTHHYAGDQSLRGSNYLITGNTFFNVASYCLQADDCDGVVFTDNTCDSCGSIALVYRSSGVTINNNIHSSIYSGLHCFTGRCVIFFDGVTNGEIAGNTINNSYKSGIQLTNGSVQITIDGNTINGSSEYGILVQTPDNYSGTVRTSGITVMNNTIDGTTRDFAAIRFYKLSGINTIDGNHILSTSSSDSDGMDIRFADNTVITGNDISNVGRYGIHLALSDNATVSSNTINPIPNTGILIEGLDGNDVTGLLCENNTITKPGEHGIHLRYCDSCTVSRNRITDPASGWQVRVLEVEGCSNCTVDIYRTGWFYSEGEDKWYYFSEDGYMQTGWQKIKSKWYYFDKTSGAMQTGWKKLSGKWYYFAGSGAMQTGWQKIGGKWYFFNSDGDMRTGWYKENGKWYHFSSDGSMHTGWQKLSGGVWYYFNSSGSMKTGWLQSGGNWYYFSSSGAMLVNTTRTINGKDYQFNASGVCTNP